MGDDQEKAVKIKEMVMENCVCRGCPSYRDCAGGSEEEQPGK